MQSDKSATARASRPAARWFVPLAFSLCLHLLFLGLLGFWRDQPRTIIPVQLLEAYLVPAKVQEKSPQPERLPAPLPEPVPVAKKSLPVPKAIPRRLTKPARVTPPATAPAVSSRAPAGSLETEAVASVIDPAPLALLEGTAALEPEPKITERVEAPVTPSETGEQRYRREQFAYIRQRVLERLVYPPLARRQGWAGQVKVEFTVRADGSIDDVRIVASSGRALLDQQALRAVQAAAPFPAPPVPATLSLPVAFTVESLSR